jgi:D-aminoacyl-tRNA deacylase
MRAVIQRVQKASVLVQDEMKANINKGLLVFVGFEDADTMEDIVWLSGKLVKIRIFNDENEIMNLSIHDVGGEFLIISQFTLHASTKKGNRPSYIKASKAEQALPLYESFIKQLQIDAGSQIKSGIFGADMKVSLINDGPVTIYMDTKNKE